MSDGLSGLVNRIIAWADRLQREHGVLGFPYAVVKKYGDDEGGRQAALITYYGFLSIQPGVQRAAAVAGSALIVFAVLLVGAKLLLARPGAGPGAMAGRRLGRGGGDGRAQRRAAAAGQAGNQGRARLREPQGHRPIRARSLYNAVASVRVCAG